MAFYYHDRDGKAINRQEWLAKRSDPDYTLLRHYLSDKMRVKIEWCGGPFSTSVPPGHARPFTMTVWNMLTVKNASGVSTVKEVPDNLAGESARTVEQVVNLYESFLVENHAGEWLTAPDGTSRFIERGNLLAPYGPGVPIIENPELEAEFGSW